MRAANITAAVSVLAWLGLALIGMDLVRGVAERAGSANFEQVKFLHRVATPRDGRCPRWGMGV